jgi:uncharacterized membrane protein YfcA
MTTEEILIALAIGFGTGFLSGLIGLGGGVFFTPMLRIFLGTPQILALATPLPVLIPTAISGSFAYYKDRLADFRLGGLMLIGALPMTWVGATLVPTIGGRTLMLWTAGFIMLVAGSFIVRSIILKERDDDQHHRPDPTLAITVGAIGGFFAGLLGIGGGIIYIPAILRFFRRPMKVAQATSLAMVAIVAALGTVKHSLLGNIDWELAMILASATIPAGYLGARVAVKLRNRTLERIFGILTMAFGIYFLITEL